MKKITLSVGLLASVLFGKAQENIDTNKYIVYNDTLITWLDVKRNYYVKEYIKDDIILFNNLGEKTCIHLYDNSPKLRKIIIETETEQIINVFDSKDNVICSPSGRFNIIIKKPKLIVKI
tara:strand:+ start:81 stop:440 length:360 start_codon:yes stop_codon:yes gene_type:complete